MILDVVLAVLLCDAGICTGSVVPVRCAGLLSVWYVVLIHFDIVVLACCTGVMLACFPGML